MRCQFEEHAPYGGVVPELAATRPCRAISTTSSPGPLHEAGVALPISTASRRPPAPGSSAACWSGLTTAKALAAALDKPLIAVNHLEAHALTARLTDGLDFPYLLLLVSGGHSQFVLVRGVGDYARWGTTIDDALGEAFDKVAKLLDLGVPGGPEVERHGAAAAIPRASNFPARCSIEARLDFSFSGLKTAVRLAAEAIAPLTPRDVADICASFQPAVTEIVSTRAGQALARLQLEQALYIAALVVAGASQPIRLSAPAFALSRMKPARGWSCRPFRSAPTMASMVAWAGAERLALGDIDSLDVPRGARWPLDSSDMVLTLRFHGH